MTFKHSSFSIIMASFALFLLGCALLPQVKMKLQPDRSLPTLYVQYSLRNANAVVVDSEITSRLEALFSNVEGLQNLTSRTGSGYGNVVLKIDKEADMDAVRFAVSTMIRQIVPYLPEGASYPQIYVSRPDEEVRVKQLMSLTLTGDDPRWTLGKVAEETIKKRLSQIEGIHLVSVSGYTPMEWQLVYDKQKLKRLGLSAGLLRNQIQQYYRTASLGTLVEPTTSHGNQQAIPVRFQGLSTEVPDWDALRINAKGRLLPLTDVVTPRKIESSPSSYSRINGLSSIQIRIESNAQANQLAVGNAVKQAQLELNASLPASYRLNIAYDGTVFLKEELYKIAFRIGLSLLLLLLFVWLVSRSLRYLALLLFSLLCTLGIACLFYYAWGVELHTYSLAGLTISLGIVIDNTIVMADHLRLGKGLSVFRGIVAATFTTCGALAVVWFLDEQQQIKLLDFSYVILINLGVSLLVSLLLVPSLLHRFPLPRPSEQRSWRSKRQLAARYQWFHRLLLCSKRWRLAFFVLAVLAFGLPVFRLPKTVEGEKGLTSAYNATVGSELYNETLRPWVDRLLGGSLRLFLVKTEHRGLDQSNQRTVITMNGTMYAGTTLEQSNTIAKRVENVLTGFPEIEQFHTQVSGRGSVFVRIFFTPENEFSGAPHQIKSTMERTVSEMGVGDWTISGVGRGFNNSLQEGRRNSRVTFYGYNLDQLKAYAERFKTYLLDIQRVEGESIFINGRATHSDQVHREHLIMFNKERIRRRGFSEGHLLYALSDQSTNRYNVMSLYDEGSREPVVLVQDQHNLPDYWDFYMRALPIGSDQRIARMSGLGRLKVERKTDLINKENQEYTMVVEFDFIGSYGQKEYLVGRVIKKMQDELPIGYRLKQQTFYGGMWGDKPEEDHRLGMIFLILLIIFGICAIAFESLVQPLIVLCMIPISFIGVFLTFYAMNVPFGQGGYVSFLLLSGLTVNSALYILNDLNAIRRKRRYLESTRLYVQAFRQKITPILLTIFSTVLSLVPFLYEGRNELFWFSIALGTVGGLLFSLIAIVLYLPLMIGGKKKKERGKNENGGKVKRERVTTDLVCETAKN